MEHAVALIVKTYLILRWIVVALIDDEEVTLKYIYKKDGSIALKPANPNYQTRIFSPDRVKIQGKLAMLIRHY